MSRHDRISRTSKLKKLQLIRAYINPIFCIIRCAMVPTQLLWGESTFASFGVCDGVDAELSKKNSLDRLTQTSKELSTATKRTCIPAQADVRQPDALRRAVTKAIETFGRIDFVVCGAAGNFLAPISGLSENAFKTVVEIDTVSTLSHSHSSTHLLCSSLCPCTPQSDRSITYIC